jgi:predicted nucleic acid-binding protein
LIVIDASAVVELVLATAVGKLLARRLRLADEPLTAPDLIDLEVIQALRRYVREGKMSDEQAAAAFYRLLDLQIERHPPGPLLPRIWRLRNSLSAYDAAYVALAEVLDAPLLTRDRRIFNAHGSRARVEVV